MRKHGAMFMAALLASLGLIAAACDGQTSPESAGSTLTTQRTKERKMKIAIGSKTFTATLENNPNAKELKARLPLKVSMTELNGNEKYVDLPKPLPTDAKDPGTIRTGDLLLYGDRTLVLFYKTFKTSYQYTRVGRIENASGLEEAVGRGDVSVAFEAE